MRLLFLLPIVLAKDYYFDDFNVVENKNTLNASRQNMKSFSDALDLATVNDKIIIPNNQTYYMISRSEEKYFENLLNLTIVIDGKLIMYNDPSQWPSDNVSKFYNFIDIRNSKNIIITGNGIIDGQGFIWWQQFFKNKIYRQRPSIIEIKDSQNIIVENITLLNGPRFHVNADNILNLIVRNMVIWVNPKQNYNIMYPFNTDGIDVKGKNIHVYNISISNFDDSVAIKPLNSNDIDIDNIVMNCSSNILIEDINILYGAGLSIGSVTSSHDNCVENVVFQNIHAKNPLKFIYIKTQESSKNIKARVNNITYQNMTAINPYAWPIYLGPQQQKEPDGTGEGIWPNTNPYVSINNITFKNIIIKNNKRQSGLLRCNITNPCTNIKFINVSIHKKRKYKKIKPYSCDEKGTLFGSFDSYTKPKPDDCGLIHTY